MYDFLENTKGLRNVELQKHHILLLAKAQRTFRLNVQNTTT